MALKRAVFLDKDGTLLEDAPYNVDPARMRLLPGAAEGVRLLYAAGYALIVVSNQSGVARGYFAAEALYGVEKQLRVLLARAADAPLTDFYACPHHPEGSVPEYTIACDCRKPQPGLLLRAAREHRLALAHCWMVGDILNDVEAGHRAGCRTVLVDNGGETEWVAGPHRTPDAIVDDLAAAARFIFAASPAMPEETNVSAH